MEWSPVHIMYLDPETMAYTCEDCGRKREAKDPKHPGRYTTTVKGDLLIRHVYGGATGLPDLGGLDLNARTGRNGER